MALVESDRPVTETAVRLPPHRAMRHLERRPHRATAEPPRDGTAVVARELDCVRDRLGDATLRQATRRALALNVSAERVLVAAGVLDEETYVRALAAWCGVPFEPLLPSAALAQASVAVDWLRAETSGLLMLQAADGPRLVSAPHDARLFVALCERQGVPPRLSLTTHAAISRMVAAYGEPAFAADAARRLSTVCPDQSAAPRPRRRRAIVMAALAIAVAVITDASLFAFGVQLLLGLMLVAWSLLRLGGVLLAATDDPAPPLSDRDLPIYTVIAALYREAASVRSLVEALQAFDYPREKLDIKLVIEPDDAETRAALAQLHLPPHVEIVTAPASEPRTKPKALNAALPRARGRLLAVFDAEDRPEPDQLRRAAQAFAAGGPALACVQARLTIDNTDDGWLAGMFTAEYAGQFDVFLPALAALRLPIPLGGSSNHFRTAVLHQVGGWDSFNVTEDADLGMRLARRGYRTGVIASTTYEEAPSRLRPWLYQRTRWFKGWMQTACVHLRHPIRLWRDLGPRGFATFLLLTAGTVLAALMHPVLVATMVVAVAYGHADIGAMWFGTAAAVLGYTASAVVNAIGLMRRGLHTSLWVVALTPLHWLLLSAAAWRALHQLMHAPYKWEKTEHGLARSSRRDDTAAALRKLERHLSAALAHAPARSNVADRRRSPRDGA